VDVYPVAPRRVVGQSEPEDHDEQRGGHGQCRHHVGGVPGKPRTGDVLQPVPDADQDLNQRKCSAPLRLAGMTEARPDDDIVDRLGRGDPFGMELLYERYARPAYSLARRICRDQDTAQDVVQEVFLGVWRDPFRYDLDGGRFASWLLAVVHHQAVTAVRREAALRGRTPPPVPEDEEPACPPGCRADEPAPVSAVGGQVRDALGRLPRPQRQALLLAYFGGLTQGEVAAQLGVSRATVYELCATRQLPYFRVPGARWIAPGRGFGPPDPGTRNFAQTCPGGGTDHAEQRHPFNPFVVARGGHGRGSGMTGEPP